MTLPTREENRPDPSYGRSFVTEADGETIDSPEATGPTFVRLTTNAAAPARDGSVGFIGLTTSGDGSTFVVDASHVTAISSVSDGPGRIENVSVAEGVAMFTNRLAAFPSESASTAEALSITRT